MALRDANGRVLAVCVCSFDYASGPQYTPLGQAINNWPPTLAATLKEPYNGVKQGLRVVPLVYYAKSGLWQGEAFTLCGPETKVCGGPGLFSQSNVVTGNKYGAARMGANLLEAGRQSERSRGK